MQDVLQQLARSEGYLAADPANNELLARVIDLSLAAADSERAERHVRDALQRYPDDSFFLARLGTVHLARQQWADAAAVLSTVLARQPDINLAYNLAYAYLWLGRHADAYAALSPYVDAPALSGAMATLLVRAQHHLGELDGAIALAERLQARGMADPALLAAASLACFDGERLDLAEQWSTAALAAGAERVPLEALITAGSLALAHTDGERATERFQQVLARNPAEGRSWSGLGTASLLAGDLAAAGEQLEQAVRYMPGHIGSWHLLGWSRLLAGQTEAAGVAFQTALELDRNFGESHGGMAVIQARLGQREQAEASVERALRLDPEGLSARYAQMILAGQTEDPVRFQALARRLLSTRQGAFGQNLGDVLARHVAK